VKPNQKDLAAAAVLAILEQLLDAAEPRLPRQIRRDVRDPNPLESNRRRCGLVHRVAAATLTWGWVQMRTLSGSAALNAAAQTLGEDHGRSGTIVSPPPASH